MNKRDLIKALFKNPTIKALYESGHFDASDINRAILMEANEDKKDTASLIRQIEQKIQSLQGQINDLLIRAQKEVQTDKSKAKATRAEARPLKKEIEALQQKANELRELAKADIEISKAAAQTPSKKDDKVSQKVSTQIVSMLDDLKGKISQAKNNVTADNAASTLDQATTDVDTVIPAINHLVKKEQDAVKAAKAGEKVDAEKTAKLAPVVKGWKDAKDSASKAIRKKKLDQQQIDEATTSPEKFKEVFGLRSTTDAPTALAQFKAIDTDWLNEQLEKVRKIKDQEQKAQEAARIAATLESWNNYLKAKLDQQPGFQIPKGFTFPTGPAPKSEEEFEQQFIAPLENEAGEQSSSDDTRSLELGNSPEAFVNTFDYYSNLDSVLSTVADEKIKEIGGAYITLRLKPEIFKKPEGANAQINETTEENRDRILTNFPDISKIASGPSKMSKEAKKKYRNALRKGDEEMEKVLSKIKDLIEEGKISLGSQKVSPDASSPATEPLSAPGLGTKAADDQTDDSEPTQQPAAELETREQKLLAVQPQQEEALQQAANPKADEDLSVLEQAEMDSAWKEQLDIFFGKNPNSSSFMRRLLLRDQASMLYSMIATLDKIIQGPRKKGDELEASSLSDQYDEDQPKDNLEEQVINEVFSSLFGKKEKNEPVEISKESRGHMRQDLEAMVSLLRSLKEDIRGYSKYATSSSVDPRFDGSTLKKAMDAKLEVVQERIAMLTEQIKTSISQQDKQVAADAVQNLEEVMDLLSEADESDRRMKIKRVREVYEEMRRLYIDGLMTSLENNEPQKSKEGAKRIKDYVMEQEDFLSFFPTNIVSGGTVMTLGDAYESMKAIIGKFIDTIRDVVTITKTQNVSKESLALASRDLIGIAEAIEKMFKIPSKIDSDFVKKIKEAAASNPDNQSITNEKPQEGEVVSSDQDVDMLKPIKDWFSSNASAVIDKVSEKLLKALANGFKGKNITDPDTTQQLKDVAASIEWYSSLSEDQKNALEVYSKNILNSIRSQSLEENLKTELIQGLKSAGLDEKYAKRVYPAFIGLPVNHKDIITKLMKENMESVVKYVYTFLSLYEDFGQETAETMIDSESDLSSSETGDAVEPPTSTPVASRTGLSDYVTEKGLFKNIKSYEARVEFTSFIEYFLTSLLGKEVSENLARNFVSHLRGAYSNMDKVVKNIMKQSNAPESLKSPLKDALSARYKRLLKYMSVKQLTKLTAEYIKSEKVFLLLDERELTEAFESLVSVLNVEDEGTLDRTSPGDQPLSQEYLNKIAEVSFPETLSGMKLEQLLQKILKGDLGEEAMNKFSERIKNTFTLTPKSSDWEESETDVFDSYLFDPISEINILSGFRKKYGKYVPLYLAKIYKQITQNILKKSFDNTDFQYGYPNVSTEKVDMEGFLKTYEKPYEKFKKHFSNDIKISTLQQFASAVMIAIKETVEDLSKIEDDEDKKKLLDAFKNPKDNPIFNLSHRQVFDLANTIKKQHSSPSESGSLEESLKPIIEKMLKEHYNH